MILRVGDFITYWGREDGVKIIAFTGYNCKEGPIGIEYLPWRVEEKQWAIPLISLRGNPRHIIAYPTGVPNYGEHICWSSVRLCNHPN